AGVERHSPAIAYRDLDGSGRPPAPEPHRLPEVAVGCDDRTYEFRGRCWRRRLAPAEGAGRNRARVARALSPGGPTGRHPRPFPSVAAGHDRGCVLLGL